METALTLSADARRTAGILLLAIVAVEYGGTYMLRIVHGRVSRTAFQRAFERAGHAHAGVLVTLALVSQVLVEAAGVTGAHASLARGGIPLAAALMPAGFFLSAIGRERTRPNRFVWVLYAGAVSLAVGAVALGIGLLMDS
jgi:hypothetical protein